MNIVLVDDHSLIRSGLRQALADTEFKVVAEASSVQEGLAVLNTYKPEIALIDINLGSHSGIDLISKATTQKLNTKFVVLTMHDDLQTLESAKQAGAAAYVIKSAPIDQLIQTLNTVGAGTNKFIKAGSFQQTKIVKDYQLTQREIEVLTYLPSGATAAAIGSLLFLTEATVKTHLAAIYRKLGATNRAQAVSIALGEKLINQ
ncbi:MAG: response regulator transcription factor [Actinobacteria bacterium]|nr:response regulator transcription factor [Actinomycetota bacterium]